MVQTQMQQQHSAEDWQAQLEEVLALQSIFADDFRVTHIPGHRLAGGSSGAGQSSSSDSTDDGLAGSVNEVEEQLQALLLSPPPDAAVIAAAAGTCHSESSSSSSSSSSNHVTCEVMVHVELPAGQLQLLLASSANTGDDQQAQQQMPQQPSSDDTSTTARGSGSSDKGRRVPFGPPIRFLPPIRLQLSLPTDYPSSASAPPLLQLQACWLAPGHSAALQQQLQRLWQEQGPGPICFSWLEHLKSCALQELGIVEELVLQEQQQQQERQQQAQEQQPQKEEGQQQQERQQQERNEVQKERQKEGQEQRQQQQQQEEKCRQQQLKARQQPQQQQVAVKLVRLPQRAGTQPRQHQAVKNQQQQQPTAVPKQSFKQQQQQQQQQLKPKPQPAKLQQQQSPWKQQQQVRGDGYKPPIRARPCASDAAATKQQQQQQEAVQPQPQLPGAAASDPDAAAASGGSGAPAAASGASGAASAARQLASVEQLAVQLLRYSAAREQEEFNGQTWTCKICFEQVLGAACLRLPECGHYYCSCCLRSHAASQLDQGGVENMRCPEPSCRRLMPPFVVKELLGPEGFTRWEELLLQRTLDRMEDVVYCPRCDSVVIEDADHCAQCAACLFVFCTFCCDSWHPGSECLDPHERLKVLERRKGASSAADRARQLDLANQLMSLKYLDTCSKKCPSCGMATIKNEGCNKMSCVYCRAAWCWKCNQVIAGYDHFRESRCNMFDQEEIARWNALMWQNERAREVEMGQIMLQVRGQAPGVRFCRCPVCGQENLREGRNNLLRCWSCTSSFCAACRTWLRAKVGQHFVGKGACKQHSD